MARRCAPPPLSRGSASTSAAATASASRAPASPAATAPRWARAWSSARARRRAGQQRRRDAQRAAEPAGRHPDRAVPETGTRQVSRGVAGRLGRHVLEGHLPGVAGRHAHGVPGVGDRGHAGSPQVGGEEPGAVRRRGRDQGVRAGARAGAPRLGPVEPPPGVARAGTQHRLRGLRGPHPPQLTRTHPTAGQLVQDRVGVGVRLRESAQHRVRRGQVGQRGPPLRRVPPAG